MTQRGTIDRVGCSTCAYTGYVCDVCREADGNCTCEDGPELVECDDCQEGDNEQEGGPR